MRASNGWRFVPVAMLGGFVAGDLIATKWNFKVEKDFWDVLTAFGTIAAAIAAFAAAGVAVWIALRQEAINREAATIRARLIASTLVQPLATIIEELDAVKASIEGTCGTPVAFEAKCSSLGLQLGSHVDIAHEALANVAVLNPRLVRWIAEGQVRITQLSGKLLAASQKSHTSDERAAEAKDLLYDLNLARCRLQPAWDFYNSETFLEA